MKHKHVLFTLTLLTSLPASIHALEYDQTVVAIFGAGNPDTGWTTGTGAGLELALRAKNRDTGATPNVNGVYSFNTGVSTLNPSRALWNYEFSIDVGSQSFSMYDFYLGIDLDPGAGVNYTTSLIDPLGFLGDNAYGKAGTLNGQGIVSSYAQALIDGQTIAQNSLNIVFAGLDPNVAGIYDYRLFATEKAVNNSPLPSAGGNPFIESLASGPVADVNIRVIVSDSAHVPDAGSTLALLGLSLAGAAGMMRRSSTRPA